MTNIYEIAAIRHQAEIYSAQGLHREAQQLCSNFLSSRLALDSVCKTEIKKQIELFSSRQAASINEEKQLISIKDIRRIKKGWIGHYDETECLVSALALMRIGYYSEALEEFKTILQHHSGKIGVGHVKAIARCLIKINKPYQFIDAVDRFLQEIFQKPGNKIVFKVWLVEQINPWQHPHQSFALYLHLLGNLKNDILTTAKVEARIATIGDRIQSALNKRN